MPEDTTTTEPNGEGQSDQDKNFEKLRQQLVEANQRIETLEPKALREDVRGAGFDPSSDKGKVLVKDISRGEVTVEDGQELPEVLRKYAEDEYGWKPPTNLTTTEQRSVTDSQRLSQIQDAGSSEQPAGSDLAADYEKRILEAREAGNFALASQLQTEYERKVADRRQPVG